MRTLSYMMEAALRVGGGGRPLCQSSGLLLVVFWLYICVSPALVAAQDTLIIRMDDYLDMVRHHHPMAIQARLLDDVSDAYDLKAKAGFDPTLSLDYDAKEFADKSYYRRLMSQLKLPTWLGADVKIAYERNRGLFLDDSESIPDNGLLAAGISIPLGRGLIYDERRRGLQEAELYRKANDLKRRELFNKLLFSAAKDYLKWQVLHEKLKIQERVIQIAEERFENTRSGFEVGDRPAIDTLEATVNLRSRLQELAKIRLKIEQARNMVNTYLWDQGLLPLEIQASSRPEPLDLEPSAYMVDTLLIRSPELMSQIPTLNQLQIELQMVELDQRLARENLKPELNVNFNPLLRVDDADALIRYNPRDYKWGLDFYYPLLNRKSRADLQLQQITAQQIALDQDIIKQNLEMMVNNLIAAESNLAEQTALLSDNVVDYQTLLQTEQLKYQIGESSLFLINSRETKLLDASFKMLDLQELIILTRFDLVNVYQLFSL